MLVKELYKNLEDGTKLFKTYSDENYLIKQIETDLLFEEAIDIENAPYTYEETDILIENDVE